MYDLSENYVVPENGAVKVIKQLNLNRITSDTVKQFYCNYSLKILSRVLNINIYIDTLNTKNWTREETKPYYVMSIFWIFGTDN